MNPNESHNMLLKQDELHQVSDLLIEYAASLMSAGTHTARVVHNTNRIAKALDYEAFYTIFHKNMTVMVRKRGTTETYTVVRSIPPMSLNFQTIALLSSLSWAAVDERLTIEQIHNQYMDVVTIPRYSRWEVLFLVACAGAGICRLFNGDMIAMGFVFLGSLCGFFLRQELAARHVNHYMIFIAAALTSSMVASLGIIFDLGTTQQTALATSVLFLIPGVPLINSMMDILDGHVLSGISRFVNASILIISITIGFMITVLSLGIERF